MWGQVQKDLHFLKAFSKPDNLLKHFPILKWDNIIILKIKMLFSGAFSSFSLSPLWEPQSCRELKLQNYLDKGHIN